MLQFKADKSSLYEYSLLQYDHNMDDHDATDTISFVTVDHSSCPGGVGDL